MSQTTMDSLNAEMLELLEKHLKLANLQVDTALKQEQTRFLPWQVALSGLTAGAAVAGALIALGHWL